MSPILRSRKQHPTVVPTVVPRTSDLKGRLKLGLYKPVRNYPIFAAVTIDQDDWHIYRFECRNDRPDGPVGRFRCRDCSQVTSIVDATVHHSTRTDGRPCVGSGRRVERSARWAICRWAAFCAQRKAKADGREFFTQDDWMQEMNGAGFRPRTLSHEKYEILRSFVRLLEASPDRLQELTERSEMGVSMVRSTNQRHGRRYAYLGSPRELTPPPEDETRTPRPVSCPSPSTSQTTEFETATRHLSPPPSTDDIPEPTQQVTGRESPNYVFVNPPFEPENNVPVTNSSSLLQNYSRLSASVAEMTSMEREMTELEHQVHDVTQAFRAKVRRLRTQMDYIRKRIHAIEAEPDPLDTSSSYGPSESDQHHLQTGVTPRGSSQIPHKRSSTGDGSSAPRTKRIRT